MFSTGSSDNTLKRYKLTQVRCGKMPIMEATAAAARLKLSIVGTIVSFFLPTTIVLEFPFVESLSFHHHHATNNDDRKLLIPTTIVDDCNSLLLPLKEQHKPIPIIAEKTESSALHDIPTDVMCLVEHNHKQEHDDDETPLAHRTALVDGIVIKPSEGKGFGAFASLPILNGAWLGEYQGEIMTQEEVNKRYWNISNDDGELSDDTNTRLWVESRKKRNQTTTGEYLFDVGDDMYIDGEDIEKSSWCRFINHASSEVDDDKDLSRIRCNAESRNLPETWIYDCHDGKNEAYIPPRMFFVALRDIAIGEEICFDYGDHYWDSDEDIIIC